MNKLGIVIAMEVETVELVNLIGLRKLENEEDVYIKESEFGRFSNTFVIISGIGMENAAIATQHLVLKYNVNYIINIGYAGSNILEVGKLVSPTKVYNIDFDLSVLGYKRYKIPKIEELELNAISKYTNTICYSANHFVTSSSETDPTIYDMELHGVAMVCNRYKIPVSAIKIVTDCLDENVYNKSESDIEFSVNIAKALVDTVTSNII